MQRLQNVLCEAGHSARQSAKPGIACGVATKSRMNLELSQAADLDEVNPIFCSKASNRWSSRNRSNLGSTRRKMSQPERSA